VQASRLRSSDIASDLKHPGFVRPPRDAGDVHNPIGKADG
jgi:hypothetical protein